jgi:hypothetical protein
LDWFFSFLSADTDVSSSSSSFPAAVTATTTAEAVQMRQTA